MKKHYTCKIFVLAFMLSLCGSISAFAQAKPKFEIVSCVEAVGDMTAQTHKKLDGNNKPFAIIKVSSTDPDDDLLAYTFSFGMINNLPPELHDGNLWIYVGQNAKNVTIRRDGYQSIEKKSMPFTVQSGRTYALKISPTEVKIDKQEVKFSVTPADSKAIVMVQSTTTESKEEKLGEIDSLGVLVDSLSLGVYNYRISSDLYEDNFGKIILDDKNATLEERIKLKPYFSTVTFKVDGDADIYVDDVKKGHRQCKLQLKFGQSYNIECKQDNYISSIQSVKIEKTAEDTTILLKSPQPITGFINVVSFPEGASVFVDDVKQGLSPIDVNTIIGKHRVTVEKDGYESRTFIVDVKQNGYEYINAILLGKRPFTIETFPKGANLYVNGEYVGKTPYKSVMLTGDYNLSLTKRGYKPIEHIGQYIDVVNDTSLTLALGKQYFKSREAYIQADMSLGALKGPTIAFGGYFHNFNIEVFGTFGIKKTSFYSYSITDYYDYYSQNGIREGYVGVYREEVEASPISVGARFGYGIHPTDYIRITPQAGYMAVTNYGMGAISDILVESVCLGIKGELGLTSNISLVVAPQYRIPVCQGDKYKSLANSLSQIKHWGNGFDVLLGISINM